MCKILGLLKHSWPKNGNFYQFFGHFCHFNTIRRTQAITFPRFLKQSLIMKLVQKSLYLDGLSKYSLLFFIAFILWAVGREQNPFDTR